MNLLPWQTQIDLHRFADRFLDMLEIFGLPVMHYGWGIDPVGSPAAVLTSHFRSRIVEVYWAKDGDGPGLDRWTIVTRGERISQTVVCTTRTVLNRAREHFLWLLRREP